MKQKDVILSVIIPAYNEGERIVPALLNLKDYFEDIPYSYEIIVVDDGSKDDTTDVVAAFRKENPKMNIRVFRYRENSGKGYAVRYGALFAHGEYVLFLDADGAIDIEHLEIFWEYIGVEHDVVIGSIEIPGHRAVDKNQWYRRLLGKASKLLIRATVAPGIYDTQRAFKMFTKDAAQEIFERQTIDRWGFDIELIVIARTLGYRIKELPVTWINPDGSKVGLSVYLTTLRELGAIIFRKLRGHYQKVEGGIFAQLQEANSIYK